MPKTTPAPDPEVEDEPSVPVVDAEPAADEGGDSVELVRTGWVRLRFGGELLRLRRPFFGELKRLRMSLEDVVDAISDYSEETQVAAARMVETIEELGKDEDLSPEERVKRRRAVQRESRDKGRALTEFSEAQRLIWWREAVETLSPDGGLPDDDKLPAWILDAQLPNTVLQHWRSVPLGRG